MDQANTDYERHWIAFRPSLGLLQVSRIGNQGAERSYDITFRDREEELSSVCRVLANKFSAPTKVDRMQLPKIAAPSLGYFIASWIKIGRAATLYSIWQNKLQTHIVHISKKLSCISMHGDEVA